MVRDLFFYLSHLFAYSFATSVDVIGITSLCTYQQASTRTSTSTTNPCNK